MTNVRIVILIRYTKNVDSLKLFYLCFEQFSFSIFPVLANSECVTVLNSFHSVFFPFSPIVNASQTVLNSFHSVFFPILANSECVTNNTCALISVTVHAECVAIFMSIAVFIRCNSCLLRKVKYCVVKAVYFSPNQHASRPYSLDVICKDANISVLLE